MHPADLLLINANVLTMDPARPHATAVAVTGERIHSQPVDQARLPAAQVVDVRGMTVASGFHVAHNHMVWFALSLAEVGLCSPASAASMSCMRVASDAHGHVAGIVPGPGGHADRARR